MNQNPLNLNSRSEEKYSLAKERESKLFLIMSEIGDFVYSLYVMGDPQTVRGDGDDDDEETVANFGKPLLRMRKSKYAAHMNFAAIGSRIYMVGGSSNDGNGNVYPSNKVFIYDTLSSTSVRGPDLNSAVIFPHLLTLGSKLFALSYSLYRRDINPGETRLKPSFQVLDTDDLESGWFNLPLPRLHVAKKKNVYSMSALAAVFVEGSGSSGGFIFISVENAGTYAFDVDNVVWDYVSDEPMPFSEQAQTIPHNPFLCCADSSLKADNFSAFRFCYGGYNSYQGFQIIETEINFSYRLFPLIPPLVCCRPSQTVLGPNGEVYFIVTGVDKAGSYYSSEGNRYVKISALEFSNSKHGLKGQLLKGCGMVKNPKVDLDDGQRLKRCRNEKMKMVHDEEQDEIVEVDLNQSLRRCSKTKKKKKNKGQKEHEGEVTKGLKLIGRWRMCYDGGPVCDELTHVVAAFAM